MFCHSLIVMYANPYNYNFLTCSNLPTMVWVIVVWIAFSTHTFFLSFLLFIWRDDYNCGKQLSCSFQWHLICMLSFSMERDSTLSFSLIYALVSLIHTNEAKRWCNCTVQKQSTIRQLTIQLSTAHWVHCIVCWFRMQPPHSFILTHLCFACSSINTRPGIEQRKPISNTHALLYVNMCVCVCLAKSTTWLNKY